MSDTGIINYPQLQLAVNGVAVGNGATVRKGDELACRITDAAWFGWQGRWNAQENVEAFATVYADGGVGLWKCDLEPGRHEMQIRRPDNEIGIDFYVNVVAGGAAAPASEAAKPLVTRADTQDQLAAAVAAGVATIQTKYLELNQSIDCRGATIVMLDGAEGWRPCITLTGTGGLANATIETNGRKAIVSVGTHTTLENVTTGAGVNYCLEVQSGECSAKNFRTADVFADGYGVFLGADAYLAIVGSFIGSSKIESSVRSLGGRADFTDCTIDATKYPAGKCTAFRGNYTPLPNGPGLRVRRCTVRGLVGPNPLDGNDGGQMWGVDRWYTTTKATLQAGAALQPQLVSLAKSMYAGGSAIVELVAATYLKFAGSPLSPDDIGATAGKRAYEVGLFSSALFEDSTIAGQLRLAARAEVQLVRTTVNSGSLPIFAGNSTPYYPEPSLELRNNEAGAAPRWAILSSPLISSAGLGVDPKDYAGVTVDGKPLTAAAVKAAA